METEELKKEEVQIKEVKENLDVLDGTVLETSAETVILRWGSYVKVMSKEEFFKLNNL